MIPEERLVDTPRRMTDVMASLTLEPYDCNTMRRAILSIAIAVFLTPALFAHCDSVKGPVVLDAQRALAARDVTPVLKWVPASSEAEVRDAFQRTLSVRTQSAAAKELADRWFFETVVRIHRQSEGEPFTGLKGAEVKTDEGIEMADAAIERGSLEKVESAILADVSAGLRQRFAAVKEAKEHAADSVVAGRHYVESYVSFIHYVETLHQSVNETAGHAAPCP